MTAAYALDVRTLGKEMWETAPRLLPTERLEKAVMFRSENEQKQSLSAGLLLRYALQRAGMDPMSVKYADAGKPVLSKNNAYISLSHSGDWVACALSNCPTGIDVQDMTEGNPTLLMKFLHRDEREFVRQGGTGSFYQIWCRKECYIKAFGWKDLLMVNTMIAPSGYGYFDFQLEDAVTGCVLSRTQPDIWVVKRDELWQEGEICL